MALLCVQAFFSAHPWHASVATKTARLRTDVADDEKSVLSKPIPLPA
jgi:hypothetical protein